MSDTYNGCTLEREGQWLKITNANGRSAKLYVFSKELIAELRACVSAAQGAAGGSSEGKPNAVSPEHSDGIEDAGTPK